MLKRIGVIALVLVVFVLMTWLTSINPGMVEIDLAFGTIHPSVSLALAVTFVLGWAFGLLCTAYYIFKLMNERRRLRSALRDSQSEVSSLRNLPIADAD
jgi:putative membrane protein